MSPGGDQEPSHRCQLPLHAAEGSAGARHLDHGATHKACLEAYLGMMQDVRMVDAEQFLR